MFGYVRSRLRIKSEQGPAIERHPESVDEHPSELASNGRERLDISTAKFMKGKIATCWRLQDDKSGRTWVLKRCSRMKHYVELAVFSRFCHIVATTLSSIVFVQMLLLLPQLAQNERCT